MAPYPTPLTSDTDSLDQLAVWTGSAHKYSEPHLHILHPRWRTYFLARVTHEPAVYADLPLPLLARQAIARTHFGPNANLDFLDFFTPVPVSSASRARAFLWLCFHYHEHALPNPFANDNDSNPDQIPPLVMLSEQQAFQENVDPPDERAWGESMTEQRRLFMAKKAREDDGESVEEGEQPKVRGKGAQRGRSRGRRRLKNMPETLSMAGTSSKDKEREREVSPADSFNSLPPMMQDAPEGSFIHKIAVPYNLTLHT